MSLTSTQTSPPINASGSSSLSTQLSLYSILNTDGIVNSLAAYTSTSSLYSLVDSLVYITAPSETTLGLLGVKQALLTPTSVNTQLLTQLYGNNISTIANTLNGVISQSTLTSYLTTYLGLPDLELTALYEQPASLIDWVSTNDPAYSAVLTDLKNLQILNLFVDLISVKGGLQIANYPQPYSALVSNIRTVFFHYVLGSALDLSTVQ